MRSSACGLQHWNCWGFATKTKREERHQRPGLGQHCTCPKSYKGKAGDESQSAWAKTNIEPCEPLAELNDQRLPLVILSPKLATVLNAFPGDLVYLSDNRWWLGGLKSGHAHVHAVDPELKDFHVRIEAELFEQIHRQNQSALIKRMY